MPRDPRRLKEGRGVRDSVDLVPALKRPWQVSYEGVTVTLAFGIPGISSYFPVEEEDRDPVVQHSHVAMFSGSSLGRPQVHGSPW